jgi:hypothetical protein
MSFESAIRRLNQLKRRRVLRDYAFIRDVAATVYMGPMLTEDMDIVVLVDSDEEYLAVFRRVGALAGGVDGMYLQEFDDAPHTLAERLQTIRRSGLACHAHMARKNVQH